MSSPVDTSLAPDQRLQRRLREFDEANYRSRVPIAAGGTPGPEGPAGTAGTQIRSGTGVPSNGLGVNGDYYLRTTTEDLYVKASGTYSILVNLKGSTGATGAAGLVWKGEWVTGTTYAENEAVTYKGSSWRSKKAANKAHEPPNAEWWELLAEGGSATVVEELLKATGIGYKKHGAEAGAARPTGFKIVMWVGSVTPTNATAEDIIVYENSASTFVPAAHVYKATGQSLAASIFSELLFDTEVYDNAGIHSTSSNTGRLTAPKDGVYLATVDYSLQTNLADGVTMLVMTKNGGNYASVRGRIEPNGENANNLSMPIFLKAGEYVTFLVYNNAVTAKTTTTTGLAPQQASLTWLGSGLKTESFDYGIVTVLPTEPVVGDRCHYEYEEGKTWDLLYTGKGTLTWSVEGGAPLRKEDVAGERATSSATYQTTGAPSITVPLAMEADITYGCSLMASQVNELNEMRIAAYKASTIIQFLGVCGNTQFHGNGQSNKTRATLAKSEAVTTRYSSLSAKSSKFFSLFVEVMPTRVG